MKEYLDDYIYSLEVLKRDIIKFRPNSMGELREFSYGISIVESIADKILANPTVSPGFLIERRISELNSLIDISHSDVQKYMYSTQINFLVDLYDNIILR